MKVICINKLKWEKFKIGQHDRIDWITYLCLKYNVNEQTDYVKCKFIMLVENNARLHFVYVSCYIQIDMYVYI